MPEPTDPTPIGYLAAVLLGLLQGVTEFLPISSSGHLALAERLGLGDPPPLLFDLALHVATVLAVFKAFWKDFGDYLTRRRAVVAWIVLACVPTAAGGMLLKDHFEAVRHYPAVVCGLLLVTASVLLAGELFARPGHARPLQRLGWWRALFVGAAQTFAILPGISRSGTTLAAGLFAGLSRDEAIKFSFSLMVPTVLGAAALEFAGAISASGELAREASRMPWGPTLAGFAAAFAAGVASLSLLRFVVAKRKLPWFSLYCLVVGTAGLLYFGTA